MLYPAELPGHGEQNLAEGEVVGHRWLYPKGVRPRSNEDGGLVRATAEELTAVRSRLVG